MRYVNEYLYRGENTTYLYIDNGDEIYITKRLMKKIAEDYEKIKKVSKKKYELFCIRK